MPAESSLSRDEALEIQESIVSLLKKGAIETCSFMKSQFISKIFLVPKSSGGFRLVLNLKSLNEFVLTEHFKLEDHKTVIRIISKEDRKIFI